MGTRVIHIKPEQDKRWLQFINQHPEATVYYHPSWLAMIAASLTQAKDYHLATENERGTLTGIMPGFLVNNFLTSNNFQNLPFSSYCQPLGDTGLEVRYFFDYLLEKWEKKEINSIEIHSREELSIESEKVKPDLDYVTHFLPIHDDLTKLRKSFHKSSVHYLISRAEKLPHEFEVKRDAKYLRIFYDLHTINRRRLGLPPLPRKLFENMGKYLIPNNLMRILLLKLSGTYVSSIIFLSFGKFSHMEYIATNPQYLRFAPNQLITWKAIQISQNEGCKIFDFGRTALSNKGLLNFKSRWGATTEQLYYYQTQTPKENNFFGVQILKGIVKPVFQHLLTSILKAITNIYTKMTY